MSNSEASPRQLTIALFKRHQAKILENAKPGKSVYWDAIEVPLTQSTSEESEALKRKLFLKYIFETDDACKNFLSQNANIRAFIDPHVKKVEDIKLPAEEISKTHQNLFRLFMLECIPEDAKSTREDPHTTGGISNWIWVILFIALALIPTSQLFSSFRDTKIINTATTDSPPSSTNQKMSKETLDEKLQQKGTTSTSYKLAKHPEKEDLLQKIQALEHKHLELEKKHNEHASINFKILENRVEDTYSTVEAVGLTSSVFGVLITIMVLFFALKESERVKDALNRINEIEDVFKTFNGIQSQAKAAKEDARFAIERAEYASHLVKEISAKAETAEKTAKSAEETAGKAEEKAKSAEETAGEAGKKAQSAVETAGEAEENAKSAVETAGKAEEKAKSAEETAGKAEGKAKSAEEISKEATEVAASAKEEAGQAKQSAADAARFATIAQTAAEAARNNYYDSLGRSKDQGDPNVSDTKPVLIRPASSTLNAINIKTLSKEKFNQLQLAVQENLPEGLQLISTSNESIQIKLLSINNYSKAFLAKFDFEAKTTTTINFSISNQSP